MKDRIAKITFEQLAQLAPIVRSQIHAGLSGVKPGYEIIEVNQTRKITRKNSTKK
jgi:hypothetical protein